MATRRFKRVTVDFDNAGNPEAVEMLFFTELDDPDNVTRKFREQAVEKISLAEMSEEDRDATLNFISNIAEPITESRNPLRKSQAQLDAEITAAQEAVRQREAEILRQREEAAATEVQPEPIVEAPTE